jgi:hypothetical protein
LKSFLAVDGMHVASEACMTTLSPATPEAPPLSPPTATARPAALVSLADRVARGFPPLACVRGFRYFTRRRVTLSNVNESGLDAEVKGKRTLLVRLRVVDGRLAAACSCSAKVLGPARCRHVWATLLEADRQALFGSLRTTMRTLALVVLEGTTASTPGCAPARRRRARPRTARATATSR